MSEGSHAIEHCPLHSFAISPFLFRLVGLIMLMNLAMSAALVPYS